MLREKSLTTVPFKFELKKALLFYKDGKSGQNLAVMFKHKNGELKNPQPYNGNQIKGLIPNDSVTTEVYLPNTLYYSEDKMVWWVKGGMRYLDIVDKPRDKKYKLPRMVLKVERGKLYVAGFKGEPSGDTELFTTPFRGIDVHGNTMGACHVVKPRGQRMADRDEWENAFFMSKFNQEPKHKEKSINLTINEFIWHTQ